MTEREQEILKLIKDDPLISQNALAEKLSITRSSVSVHISNLMKKGYIKGKGYVMSEGGHDVVVIGGANIDITGTIHGQTHKNDSNPGNVNMTLGGVGRNIAENLAHLDVNVQLISAVGDDFYGEQIITTCRNLGIDMSMSKKYGDYRTSVYMQVLDGEGQLDIAISDMNIMEKITVDELMNHQAKLNRAKAIVADGNLEVEVIEYLAMNYGDKLFYDTVSIAKSIKVAPYLNHVYCMTPNIKEAQHIIGKTANIEETLTALHQQGVKFPVITDGSAGAVYYENGVKKSAPVPVVVKSVTGAGDALMAGLVYGFIHEKSTKECMDCGMIMASKALESDDSVNNQIKHMDINNKIKEIS